MSRINCQLTVCILVVLICFKNSIDNYSVRAEYTHTHTHLDSYMWTLHNPMASLSAAI